MVKIKKQKIHFWKKKTRFTQKPPFGFKAIAKFLMTLLLVGGLGIGVVRLKYMFVDSEYFIVKGIDIKLYDENGSLRKLSLKEIPGEEIKGTSIFFVDLNELKERIGLAYPEFKDVVIRRLLPNKLVVQAKLRKAVAQIRSDRFYLVDSEGVLLPDVKNFPDADLPIIVGIGTNLAKISASKFSKFEKEKLDRTLNLIEEMRSIGGLSKYKLKMVDITDPGNMSFFLETANVEIKIGNSDFHNRLKVLETVLERFGSDIDKFKYIDLRFEDPIIGPR